MAGHHVEAGCGTSREDRTLSTMYRCAGLDRVGQRPSARGRRDYRRVRWLSESAGNVILGLLLARGSKQLLGDSELHQPTQQEEPGRLRHTRRLLHVVCDNGDRTVLLQVAHEFLDLCGSDRIERRAGLI